MGIFKNDDQKPSQFGFDEKSMAGKAVKAVRWIYAITGVLALIAGIALLFAPAKSLVFLTTVLGFYFVITAAIRLFTAIFEPLLPTGWRVTSIISNLLIILGGVIILRNQAFSTATLTTMVVIVAGFGWIVEGVMSILESELSSNRALAILSGALSIIAGMFVFIYPLWSAKMLVIFSGAALLVFGVTLIVRAFSLANWCTRCQGRSLLMPTPARSRASRLTARGGRASPLLSPATARKTWNGTFAATTRAMPSTRDAAFGSRRSM